MADTFVRLRIFNCERCGDHIRYTLTDDELGVLDETHVTDEEAVAMKLAGVKHLAKNLCQCCLDKELRETRGEWETEENE